MVNARLGGEPFPLASQRSLGAVKPGSKRWARFPQERSLKLLGFLLLLAGWGIVLAAVVLLPPSPSRPIFVLAGLGVEVLGLALVLRSHPIPRGEEE
jgi:hypothetical protein